MYAAAHTSLALVAKRRTPAASLLALMITAQATELLWALLSYAGIEHSTVDRHGVLHLEHLPYSHSLLIGLGGGLALWGLLRYLADRPEIAGAFGWVFASHVVLDVVHHEANIRVLPWMAHPAIGLNLQALPWLDFAIETALCLGCWAYVRGSRKLLAALVALNVLNVPLMLAGDGGASSMAHSPYTLPTVILATIVLAWVVIQRYATRSPRVAGATRPQLERSAA